MCSDREGKGEQNIQVKVAFIFYFLKITHLENFNNPLCGSFYRDLKLEEETLKHSLLYAEHIVPVLDGHHPVHSLYQSFKTPL